jgi:hypothetical protein
LYGRDLNRDEGRDQTVICDLFNSFVDKITDQGLTPKIRRRFDPEDSEDSLKTLTPKTFEYLAIRKMSNDERT